MTGARAATAAFTIGAALALAGARPAQARSTFTINNLDAPGVGFNDPTPAAPVGGNTGTTVGQQRVQAFRAAADLWAGLLDSRVPIVIDARFGPLSCSGGRIVLGQARATGLEMDRPGLPPGILFPEPLADRIAEVDLNPGEADIEATFNGALQGCSGGLQDWYYGLDGKPPGADVDLVSVILHELGHGLGFSSAVDEDTGQLAGGLMDAFSAHLVDDTSGRAWRQMTDAERAMSARNARHLVWDGANVTKAAASVLAKGPPRITFAPVVPGLAGALSEANFGPLLGAGTSVSGRLMVGQPLDGCDLPPDYTGAIVLFAGGVCPSVQKTFLAQSGGARAVLIADPDGISPPSSVDVPADQESEFAVTIPAIGLSVDDASRLADAADTATQTVTLGAEDGRLVGADAQGRAYLYASDPILPGSTVSHWDPLARPNLTQEPSASFDVTHDLRMEAALMRDIGWAPFCGNGRPDPGEACDDGARNSDTAAGACRTTCAKAACGDGVTDPGEQCDTGPANSDATSGACRTTCKAAACGDGVTDPGEQCDTGPANNDATPGACRTTCKAAACGDGVTDPGEQCDDGAANGASARCLPTCMNRSGDGGGGCGCTLASNTGPLEAPLALTAAATLALLLARPRRRRPRTNS